MRTPTKQILAIALVGVMVAAAGCAGWGTDGPSDNESGGSDTGDDLEDEQNQSQSDGSSSSDSDSSSDTGDSSDASSGDSDGDSASDTPAPNSDTGSSDDSDSSDGDTSNEDSDTDNGPDGTDGSDSDDSSDESDGNDGSDGSDGTDGDDGDNGTDGDDGDDTDEIGAALSVTVEDQDGNTVEGIEVVGIGPDAEIYSTETNADGQASYDSLPAGDYEFHATTSDDYPESTTESITLADGDDKSLTVTVSDTDSGGSETSALNVTVDNHNGDPVEGANVSVLERPSGDEVATDTTDSNGTVMLDVPDGEYDVIAEHDEANEPVAGLVTVDGDTETSLTLDTSEGLATGVVKVVDQNGDPVEGEEVTLWPPGTVEEEATETRETDANGEVRIKLSAGEPEDAVMFDVEVRDQEQTLGIMADAYQGVQEVTFEVDTAENDENETSDMNETNATVALA